VLPEDGLALLEGLALRDGLDELDLSALEEDLTLFEVEELFFLVVLLRGLLFTSFPLEVLVEF
jgi:hypothetical protein